jgi:hypothetical protein
MPDGGLPTPEDDASRPLCPRAGLVQGVPLQGLIDAGRGDVPLIHLRFRCSNCRSSLTDFVVTATEATGQPR